MLILALLSGRIYLTFHAFFKLLVFYLFFSHILHADYIILSPISLPFLFPVFPSPQIMTELSPLAKEQAFQEHQANTL